MKGITDLNTIKIDTPVTLTREQLLEAYWTSHPRYIFFKSIPYGSLFLELGASDGGMSWWKDWLIPHRNDIKMYGCDLTKGKFADKYERFDELDLNNDTLEFEDNSIDAVYATHVFEHLSNFSFITQNINRILKKGGMIYLETPNQNSINTLSLKEFNKHGFKTETMNFYDDKTHIRPFNHIELKKLFDNREFEFTQGGGNK